MFVLSYFSTTKIRNSMILQYLKNSQDFFFIQKIIYKQSLNTIPPIDHGETMNRGDISQSNNTNRVDMSSLESSATASTVEIDRMERMHNSR